MRKELVLTGNKKYECSLPSKRQRTDEVQYWDLDKSREMFWIAQLHRSFLSLGNEVIYYELVLFFPRLSSKHSYQNNCFLVISHLKEQMYESQSLLYSKKKRRHGKVLKFTYH